MKERFSFIIIFCTLHLCHIISNHVNKCCVYMYICVLLKHTHDLELFPKYFYLYTHKILNYLLYILLVHTHDLELSLIYFYLYTHMILNYLQYIFTYKHTWSWIIFNIFLLIHTRDLELSPIYFCKCHVHITLHNTTKIHVSIFLWYFGN